ncbi:MAG: 50S ribosomal protein L35 [Candidatus Nomurabacteria bacterium GW2011_GWE1_32_28]|uniref:50S ribosomal protein L35 n=1 Tax=Candidatus Nomurabacteria bacterium GW2011_GWF1_31_48 TaxID=1618767 RepID=A0A0F9YFW8_9BACT|nr:MAG: 50S ribosomal protein L35 [Candidatus Nomurabacteria bacterium GW2011_GWF2_30_133]KKP28691.1 MAG: 50S ribosomal protein L35 [Candidatus Nomurabacteria bacterium GW2011_GWE2_31_40]KKP30268.1 MAG: 50S ribosomal protein L35 [Candidatus Nomurabacteria bacterium GW2011_GWF1_31_48]KKP34795.1 MAG: 50S ribosomal protein L35 [Candidatus Nomurabacteria bacterium GW2011_GWE1_32_28]HAS80747.1 50S ribosomal protein L35 [Candidatus Nomurabacteria bacterium]
MKGMKTNKSYSKRLKLTKNGKLISNKPGFNHFNAKQSRSKQLAGKKGQSFLIKNKPKSHLLPFN